MAPALTPKLWSICAEAVKQINSAISRFTFFIFRFRMIKLRNTENNSVRLGKVIGLSETQGPKLTDAPFQLINALFQLTDAQNHYF